MSEPKRIHAPRLRFEVTAETIATAIPKDSGHCMIADGLKAAMPKARKITVDLATIRFTDPDKGRRYIYLTPPDAQSALLQFDNEEVPRPFVVKATAAQVVEPKAIRKQRRATPEGPLAETGEALDSLARPLTDKRQMATVARKSGDGEGAPPIKVGGKAPRVGALRGGQVGKRSVRDAEGKIRPEVRTGQIRRFGLRQMATRRGES